MSKIITVYADNHWFGPTPSKAAPEYGTRVFYIGDNHEFKNILKKNYPRHLNTYQKFLKKCKETGTNVLNGNHEVSVGEELLGVKFLIDKATSTLLVHGDYPLYSDKDYEKWHTRKPCKSRRVIWGIKIKNLFRNKKGATKLSGAKIKIFTNLAKAYQMDNVVFGHCHPRHLLVAENDGVTIYNVPRGKTKIDIERKIEVR